MSYTTFDCRHVIFFKTFRNPVTGHPLGNSSILLSGKQPIKVLQFSAFALGKKYINDRYPRCLSKTQHQHPSRQSQLSALQSSSHPSTESNSTYIQHGENDISPPSYILNRRRRDLHNQEVANPIRRRRDARPLLPQSQRQDLGRVDPDRSLEANGEGAFEQEQHDRAGDTGCIRDGRFELDLIYERSLRGHYESHDGDHGEQKWAPAETIDKEPRDEAGDEEPELQEPGHEGRKVGAEADVFE